MKFIKPTLLTDAAFVSSTLPEADAPAWSAGTAYAVNDKAIRTATHSVYQRAVAGTTPTAPELDAVNWVLIGPTNRWAMFDQAVGTISTAGSPITVIIKPGVGDGVALLDVVGSFVTFTLTDGGATTYTRRDSLNGIDSISWFEYFNSEVVKRTALVLTGLPLTASCTLTVLIEGGGTVACGSLITGPSIDVGPTKMGMQLGIVDYSVKNTNAFGATTITKRGYAKRMTAVAYVPAARVDYVMQRLAEVRALPVVWIGATPYEQSFIYGFVKDFGMDITYQTMSVCSLTIEGLA